YFNDLHIGGGGQVTLLSDITVNGSLHIVNGTLNASANMIKVYRDWITTPLGTYLGTSDAMVRFMGSYSSNCKSSTFQKLQLSKTGSAELEIGMDSIVQCELYQWTSGTMRVSGGAFTVNGLPSMAGNFVIESGTANIHGSLANISIAANVTITGGTMNIWTAATGYGYYADYYSGAFQMSGGTLDFRNCGVKLRNTVGNLSCSISGGTIRTVGNFESTGNTFMPTGGFLELYGQYSTQYQVSYPSKCYNLTINKDASGGLYFASTNNEMFSIINDLFANSGMMYIHDATLSIGRDMHVYNKIYMQHSNDIIQVGRDIRFYASAQCYISAGTLSLKRSLYLDSGIGTPISTGTSKLVFTGTSASNIYANQTTTAISNLIIQKTGATCSMNNSSPVNETNLSSLEIKANSSFITGARTYYISGNLILAQTGSLTIPAGAQVNTDSFLQHGILTVNGGVLNISDFDYQNDSGITQLNSGSFIYSKPFAEQHVIYSGTNIISGGVFEISHNGLQIGSATNFQMSGGELKLGWGLHAHSPGTFNPAGGSVSFIGGVESALTMAGGNSLNRLLVNKVGPTGRVTLASNVIVNTDCTIVSGQLRLAHFSLTIARNLSFEADPSAILSLAFTDSYLRIGASLLNASNPGIYPGIGTVEFFSELAGSLGGNTDFYNLIINKGSTGNRTLTLPQNAVFNVANDLNIESGILRFDNGTSLNVLGILSINGLGSVLDLNFRRTTSPTNLQIHGNLNINAGKLLCLDTNGAIPNDIIDIYGDLIMTGGEINILAADVTLSGHLTTTTASEIGMQGGSFVNSATGSWQIFNCHWTTLDNVTQFTNKGLQFANGSNFAMNSSSVIKTGKGFLASQNGVFNPGSGTVEFIGSVQSYITMSGNNKLPNVTINKTGANVILSSNVVITGTLLITSGNLNSNSYPIEINGSWINNIGTDGYTCGTSEITFTSLNNESVWLNGTQTLHKLIINCQPGFIVNTLFSGILTIQADLIILSGVFLPSELIVHGNV
ncbi:MAG: hypothetical protein U1C33_05295, partial [Candidatus Cloacimonadaceae bacterium]|nr:hypothetical protein [Candidatus Cloacimonadaceae bacterium]